MKIGLLFGSFNPVHNGHLIIAEFFTDHTDLDQVWFVVSPQNPLKKHSELIDEQHRLNMVKLAIMNNQSFDVCDIEFRLPKPSYTIDTLQELSKIYPDHRFVLLLGTDTLLQLDQWKDYKKLLSHYQVYVYPRNSSKTEELYPGHLAINYFSAPEIHISSTYIRDSLKVNKSIRYLTPDVVINYLGTISNS